MDEDEELENQQTSPTKLMKIGGFLLLTATFLTMGYSRMVLGMHSLNQVFYGFLLGLWSLAFSMTTLMPALNQNLTRVESKIRNKQSLKAYLGVVFIISMTLILVMILDYLCVVK